MARILSISTYLYFLLFTSCSTPSKITGQNPQNIIEVNEAFHQVYKATQEALSHAGDGSLELKSIDLTFATTTTNILGVGAKLWVISGNHSRSKADSKQAKFTFKPEPEFFEAFSADPNTAKFKSYLVSVIKASRDIEKIEKFALSEVEVEVAFTLTKKTDGSVEIVLSPVTPSASASRERESVHTITLNFSKKSK